MDDAEALLHKVLSMVGDVDSIESAQVYAIVAVATALIANTHAILAQGE